MNITRRHFGKLLLGATLSEVLNVPSTVAQVSGLEPILSPNADMYEVLEHVRQHKLPLDYASLWPKDVPVFSVGERHIYGEDKDFDTAKERQLQQFQKFLELPDDYPVEITEGQKDTICHTCQIGNHCLEQEQFEGDQGFLDKFIRLSRKSNLPITTSIAHFSDSEPEQVRTLSTTAGYVKSMLTQHNFEEF